MKKNRVRRYSKLFLFLVSLTTIQNVEAQVNTVFQSQDYIKGTVLDVQNSLPLSGVTIEINGQKTKLKSNEEGAFHLPSTLTFPFKLKLSALGYKSQEVNITQYPIAISLEKDISDLEEVVVVGYGTQRRKDITGAIASVSKDILNYNVSSTVDALLGGAVAGVQVSQASGQPGAPSTIRIRGGNSINASNNPLYVIDGFLFFSDNSSTKVGFGGIEGELNPLNLLNPSDIASIEVLKDVSATALYGSRGSNGVIVIQTKKGERGVDKIDYQYTFGQSNSTKKLNLLSASQWARLQKDYLLNKPGYSDEEIAQLGAGYNWQEAVLRKGTSHNHLVSFRGGDEKSQYFVSGNYNKQEGIVLNSGLERLIGRINYNRQVTDQLNFGLHVTANHSKQNSLTTFEAVNYNSSPYSAGISNSLTYALYMPPVVPFYTSDGEFNYSNPFEYAYLREGSKTANPISDLTNSTALSSNAGLLANFFTEYYITSDLRAKAAIGTNINQTTQKYFSPSYTAIGLEPGGIGGIGNKKNSVLLSEFTLNYIKELNSTNRLDLLGGYTFQKSAVDFVSTLSSRFTNESLGVNNLQDGKPYGSRPIFSGASSSKLHSLLGRVNYSLYDRYHVTANVRADYSTRFAQNNKWGVFPSLGLAWNIHEESFLKEATTLNNLKLRVSAGKVGNQEIGDFEYLELLEAVYYGDGVAYQTGNTGNANLKWETTTSYNVGVDVSFWNNMFVINADVYSKKTNDLLMKIPAQLGQQKDQLVNVGNLTNKGAELSLTYKVLNNSNVDWSLTANAAYNQNKITELYNQETERILGTEILKVGESLGTFYGQIFEGVVQSNADFTTLPSSPSYATVKPGDPLLRDLNQDGHIDQNDRTVLGHKQPNYTFGLSSLFKYHNVDIFFLFQGAQGNSVYNQIRRYLERPTDAYNGSAILAEAWTENNPSTTVPRITNTPFSSELDSRYIEDASFLRLRTLTLGYQIANIFGTTSTRKTPLRIFVTGQNLFTLTKYKGYDPEVASGVDLGNYPMPRTFLAGINITF